MNQGEGTTAHNARAGQLVDFLSPKGLGSLHTLGKDLQEASARLLVASNQLASKHMGTGKSYFSPQANQFTTALEARYLSSDLSPGFEPILSGEGLASASRWMDLQFTAPEFASFPFAREVLRLQNPSPEIGDALAESRTVRQSLFAKLKRTNVVRRMHALGVDGAAPSEEPASFEQTLSTLLELSSEMQDLDTGSMELAGTQQTRPYPSRLGGAGRRFIPASHGASAGHLLRSLRHDPIHGKDYSPEALAGLPSLLQQSIGGGETNGFRPGPAITHLALSNAGRKNAAGPQAQDTAPWVGMDGFSGTFVELLKETGTSSPTEAGSPPGPPATGLRALLQRTIRGAGGQPAVTSFPLPAIAQGPEGITPALAALALQGESGEAGSQASASSAHVLEALLTQRGSGAGLRELQFATHIAAQHGELTGASGAPYAASSLPESVSFTSGLMDLPILKAIQGASQEAPPVVTPETSPFLAQLLEASPIGKALAQPADALTSPSIPLARVLHNPSVAAQMSSSSLNTSLREKAASRAHSLLQTDLGKAFALATPEAIVQEQRLQHQSAMTLLPGVSAPILGQLMGTTLGTSPQGQQGLRTGFMQPPSPGIFPLIRRISPLAPPVAPGESAQVAPLLASVANTSHQHATQIAAATGAHTPPFFAPGGQGSPRVSSGALPLGRAQGIGGFPTLMGSTEPGVPQTAFSPGSSWLPPGVAQAQAGPSAGTKAGMAWPLGAAQAERSALTTLAHVGLLAPSTVVPPSGEAPAGAPSPGTNIPGLTGGLMAASPTAPTRAQAGLGAGMYAPISFPLVRAPEVHAIPALAQGAQKTLGLESAMARARTGQQTSPINASPGVSPALLPFASGTPGTSTFPRAGTGLQEGGLSLSPASLSLQAPSYIGAPASQLGGSPSASQTLLLPWGGRQLGGGTPHEWTSPSSFAESALPFASGPSASLGNSFPEL